MQKVAWLQHFATTAPPDDGVCGACERQCRLIVAPDALSSVAAGTQVIEYSAYTFDHQRSTAYERSPQPFLTG
ncbi:hypothetical protein EVC45_21155 [Paraburkholderia sp. UYCP14C]|uniref:hypothetical protein n=1 Tax=Paraburkholderia sp. UYCP14C TaxID=2511130 RepID=UPI001021CC04|nr:hypothetical protein [Paraburkholderia sp. UYCP14C]RZF27747.1 hypothetical protein EVC45_21155 [Paraburkholderia sp. UYCP14C]